MYSSVAHYSKCDILLFKDKNRVQENCSISKMKLVQKTCYAPHFRNTFCITEINWSLKCAFYWVTNFCRWYISLAIFPLWLCAHAFSSISIFARLNWSEYKSARRNQAEAAVQWKSKDGPFWWCAAGEGDGDEMIKYLNKRLAGPKARAEHRAETRSLRRQSVSQFLFSHWSKTVFLRPLWRLGIHRRTHTHTAREYSP